MYKSEKWSIGISILALLISVAAWFISYGQLRSSNRAVDVADQARKDANVASEKALAASEQARKDAVTAAEKERIDSQGNIRLDERAWLQVSVEKAGNDFVAGTQSNPVAFRYFLRVHNYGKTAAQNIEYKVGPSPRGSISLNESKRFVDMSQNILRGKVPTAKDIPVNQPGPRTLVPNSNVPVPITISGQPPQIFSSDQWVSYIIGRVDYKDAFGGPHWYTFC
jgi:hypothetical protein